MHRSLPADNALLDSVALTVLWAAVVLARASTAQSAVLLQERCKLLCDFRVLANWLIQG